MIANIILSISLGYFRIKTKKKSPFLAEPKRMPLAGVNIARALALVEDGRSIRYAANAIGAPLTTVHRAIRRFQETGQYTRRPGSGRKRANTHRTR
jgi:hypothetical protein